MGASTTFGPPVVVRASAPASAQGRAQMGPIQVLVAIRGSTARRQTTFAGVVYARFAVDPLARFEQLSATQEETCDPLLAHWQSHEPTQASLAAGATGFAIESLVRFGIVGASRPLACAADALVTSLGGKGAAAPQAVSRARRRGRLCERLGFGSGHRPFFRLGELTVSLSIYLKFKA